MNTPPLPLFSVITSIISLFLLTIDLTVVGMMLPKLLGQSKVNDIFKELRLYLLKLGISFFVTIGLTLAVMTSRFYIPSDWIVYAIGIMVVLFSIMCSAFTYSFFRIYNLNFAEISILYQVKRKTIAENSESLKVNKRKKVKKNGR